MLIAQTVEINRNNILKALTQHIQNIVEYWTHFESRNAPDSKSSGKGLTNRVPMRDRQPVPVGLLLIRLLGLIYINHAIQNNSFVFQMYAIEYIVV